MLKIGVAGQPRDDGRSGRHVAGSNARRPEGSVLADDHGASRVLRRLAVHSH